MTYHSGFNYKCPRCGTYYAPFRSGVRCPKCGHESEEVYPMAEEALDAWLYHETLYDSGIPPAYGVFSLGDHYIYLTAKFLTSYLMERPKDREAFIENFLNKQFNFEGYEYLKPHYKEYLRYVLKLVHKHPKYSIILSKPKYLISSNRYYLGRLSLLRR